MNQFNFNSRSSNIENITPQATARTRSLFTKTFAWMFLAMLVSAAASYLFAVVPALHDAIRHDVLVTTREGLQKIVSQPTTLFWILLFSPLVFGLIMNLAFERLSFVVLFSLFMLYALCTGISLSVILSIYQGDVILKAFGSAAGLFGLMAIVGATTKTDLTNFGRLLMIGLFGLVIAMLINFFTQSSAFSYLISVVGVAIFVGLVAFHTQNIKRLSIENDGSAVYQKLGVMSAFRLYLSFINIFLFLLRIFGRRD